MGEWAPVEVKVWGDFACFTRPEMKVERVSYPIMTPSAARGVLESVFWKPEFVWRVREIVVLNDIRYFSVLRNEVKTRASDRTARGWEVNGGGYAADEDRAQRHTLALQNVAYIIRADVEPHDGGSDAAAKYRDQFRRRVARGQCFSRPYLGCREFAADFSLPEEEDQPRDITMSLGRMLLDIDYDSSGSGRGTPTFFEADLKQGILHVPAASQIEEI